MIVKTQNNFSFEEEPGICPQPLRLVLLQKLLKVSRLILRFPVDQTSYTKLFHKILYIIDFATLCIEFSLTRHVKSHTLTCPINTLRLGKQSE